MINITPTAELHYLQKQVTQLQHSNNRELERRRTAETQLRELREATENLTEFVDMFLFALTDRDLYHQEHARRQVGAWNDHVRKLLL